MRKPKLRSVQLLRTIVATIGITELCQMICDYYLVKKNFDQIIQRLRLEIDRSLRFNRRPSKLIVSAAKNILKALSNAENKRNYKTSVPVIPYREPLDRELIKYGSNPYEQIYFMGEGVQY